MNRKYFAFALPIGMVISFAFGGYGYESLNGVTNISLSPFAFLTWFLMLLATLSIDLNPPDPSPFVRASWWKQSLAFICDFVWLFNLLFVPITFALIIVHLGHLPPPWLITDKPVKNPALEAILFIVSICVFWSGMGLALHPNIRTPGMVLTKTDLRVAGSNSIARIAFFGVFAYFGVFIPLFKYFAMGLDTIGRTVPPNNSLQPTAESGG